MQRECRGPWGRLERHREHTSRPATLSWRPLSGCV